MVKTILTQHNKRVLYHVHYIGNALTLPWLASYVHIVKLIQNCATYGDLRYNSYDDMTNWTVCVPAWLIFSGQVTCVLHVCFYEMCMKCSNMCTNWTG